MLTIQLLFPLIAAEYAATIPEHTQKAWYDRVLSSRWTRYWSIEELKTVGALSPKVYEWLVDDYRSAIPHRRNRMLLFAVGFGEHIPVEFADIVMTDLQNPKISPLWFFKYAAHEKHAYSIASLLLSKQDNAENYSEFYTVISILNEIGTPEVIDVIDKAKANGLRATDGDFWIKAADAKKAILARAEEKMKAELKAKPLDK
jgi:hypothetical protein